MGEPEPAMLRALAALAKNHGWEAIEPEERAYIRGKVRAGEWKFHSWPAFAAEFGTWATQYPPPPFEIRVMTCLRCGHEWPPRSVDWPRRCPAPKCGTPYWDKPRKAT
jgi:hypothetical protein